MNEREVIRDGMVLCRACAGAVYYRPAPDGTRLSGALDYLPGQIGQVDQLLVPA